MNVAAGQPKPSQAKELTMGGDLNEAQVAVLCSVSHFTTLLGSITDW
jgi:hypothetical protein